MPAVQLPVDGCQGGTKFFRRGFVEVIHYLGKRCGIFLQRLNLSFRFPKLGSDLLDFGCITGLVSICQLLF